MPDIVSKNKRKTNGNFTSDSWTAKNRRNHSHAEVKNYLLFATKLSRPVKKALDKDFSKKKQKKEKKNINTTEAK